LNNRWNLDFCPHHVVLTWHKPFNLIWFLKQIICIFIYLFIYLFKHIKYDFSFQGNIIIIYYVLWFITQKLQSLP
jgi:hypothetical protein